MASGVGLGDKRCIMMHNIHVAHGRCYAIAVKNAAIDERHVFRTRRIGPDVEQADSIASLTEPSRGEIAVKKRANGNKVRTHYRSERQRIGQECGSTFKI